MARVGRPPQDPARQLERAHRILDAATELILRWGYDKTTIDDVAKRAEVAKGTIYLHWKTRDDLFAALLRRERVLMLTDVRDQKPATLSELFGEFSRALFRRPLLRAVLSGDSEVLGKLTRRKRTRPTGLELGAPFDTYVTELAELGAVRDDPGDHITVIGSIVYGFLFLPDGRPEGVRPSEDRIADLVADTIERTLGAGRPPSDADAVARATLTFLDATVEVARQRLADSLGSKERVQ
ncbi:DNA-binding transcriptional regulator, AcrR family [Nonomuraea solani]|uniref:DNA-binding transcriptional regulator, AcrR family n=1 Tax=Nonomuraea solani TaxID=1144553 RepID=A0A1H5UH94_9ACTN|nr:TetR/AcrR family transcriptional regulator [Nonomuraea solani]SEF74423.1 DNA-binding transcriptional regulator, AcrR family [Nonomuraea solani]